ncbi:MAG: endo-1,4-beta-xylanase [Clostridia bacterium]|nr:endo-1,4-beta-xylanase [Clostridia bacterium]
MIQEMREQFLRNFEEIDARVERDIEQNRKGNFTLCLEGEGEAVIEQLDHDFTLGGNLFMLDQLETPEKNQKYKEHFKKLFNTATVPFYWDTLEPEEGKPRFAKDSPFIYRRPPIDPCVEFCEENGITPKAHCLNYDHFVPEWVKGRPVPEIKRALIKRFEALSERYAHRIPCWEVFNELLIQNGSTPFYDADDFMSWSFRQAERLFPANTLMVNESNYLIFANKFLRQNVANARNPYFMLCQEAMRQGCRVDAVGLQFHFFVPEEHAVEGAKMLYDLKHHMAVLDQMAKLGKPLQITEITFSAYEDSEEAYAFQAEVARMFYRMWFSHPAMEGAIYWNLPDGYAFNAEPGDFSGGENKYRGGLLDFDLEPKPIYNTIYDLFHKDYCTNTTVRLEGGKASFRGFYGKYRITCGGKTYFAEFKRGGRTTVTL